MTEEHRQFVGWDEGLGDFLYLLDTPATKLGRLESRLVCRRWTASLHLDKRWLRSAAKDAVRLDQASTAETLPLVCELQRLANMS